MEERTTYVGLDVHKKVINVASLRPGSRAPLACHGSAPPATTRETGVHTPEIAVFGSACGCA